MDPFDSHTSSELMESTHHEVKNNSDKKYEGLDNEIVDIPRYGINTKINDTIDFLKAETGGFDFGLSQNVEGNLLDNVVETLSGESEVHGNDAFDNLSNDLHQKSEDSDLLGLSESHKELSDVVKVPETQPNISDNVRDLLFDEKEQDELKGFDQYTSDSNASLKVNLSCENDDTASTKSIDSAQSIPLDDRKNLVKESLIEEPHSEKLEDEENTLINSNTFSPSPKETISFVSEEAPIDNIVQESKLLEETIGILKAEQEFPKLVEEELKLEPETTKDKEQKLENMKPVISEQEVTKSKVSPVKKNPSTEIFIGPHEVFSKFGLDTWFNPEKLNPAVESLIYWRDPKISGAVFGVSLAVLISLTYFSLISVVANLALVVLVFAISFRIYKSILQAVQKTNEGHPFKTYLEQDITLPSDKVQAFTQTATTHVNAAVVELRRIFLVDDFVDSIKFFIILWTFTYVGSWFNGLTLVIIAFVALFTLPKVYENNKAQIDANLEVVKAKIAEITTKVKAAIPIGKKEEKKEQ